MSCTFDLTMGPAWRRRSRIGRIGSSSRTARSVSALEAAALVEVGRRFRAVLFVTAEPAAALFRIDAEKWPKYRPTTAAFGAHRSTVIDSVLNQLVALLTAPNNATPRVA